MSIEAGIYSLLTADATLSALVGTRIYPVFIPESAETPCLSYQLVSSSVDLNLDRTVVREKRIQFDAFAPTYAVVKQIQTALADILEGYSGTLSDGSTVIDCSPGVSLDDWEVSRDYRVTAEYVFLYC